MMSVRLVPVFGSGLNSEPRAALMVQTCMLAIVNCIDALSLCQRSANNMCARFLAKLGCTGIGIKKK